MVNDGAQKLLIVNAPLSEKDSWSLSLIAKSSNSHQPKAPVQYLTAW